MLMLAATHPDPALLRPALEPVGDATTRAEPWALAPSRAVYRYRCIDSDGLDTSSSLLLPCKGSRCLRLR